MRTWILLSARKLQTRLVAWTTLILIVSVLGTSEIHTRSNIRLLEQNLINRSETMVDAVEHDLRARSNFGGDLSAVNSLQTKLKEFVDADPTLTRLDIVEQDGGQVHVIASSAPGENPLLSALPAEALSRIRLVDNTRAMVYIRPVEGGNYGIAAVSSLQNVERYEAFNRRQAPIFAVILILVVVLLMHVMYRHVVSRRLDKLLDGIQRAKRGEAAGIPDDTPDEIGVIARTLNGLLSQVQTFNEELRREISHATDDLNKRNVALEETTRQMLEMQRQLVDSERLAAVGEMAATLAHEIGSPMTSISAHVQLLMEDEEISKEQRESLIVIRQQIQTTVEIVNEMLSSARRGPSDFVLTDLNDLLRKVVRLVRPKLMSQRIDVQMDLKPIPLVRGYPVYIQEAFLNIINNASDAMIAGGRLVIKSWFDAEGELVNVKIIDTGAGIDPSIVANIFDHFVTTKAIGKGTGLGLGIVKEILDSHRGTIQIGPAEAGGTAACVKFPAETTGVLAS